MAANKDSILPQKLPFGAKIAKNYQTLRFRAKKSVVNKWREIAKKWRKSNAKLPSGGLFSLFCFQSGANCTKKAVANGKRLVFFVKFCVFSCACVLFINVSTFSNGCSSAFLSAFLSPTAVDKLWCCWQIRSCLCLFFHSASHTNCLLAGVRFVRCCCFVRRCC